MAGDLYAWVKALHVISVIAWMAGLLYLPRIYVYHCGVASGSEASETFKVMERKLLKYIMTPAMLASLVFGFWMLALQPGWFSDGWLHAKLVLIVALIISHFQQAKWRKAFEEDSNEKSAKFFRMMNEVPTLLMVVIVILVIVKPF